jgi:hypothetical protein
LAPSQFPANYLGLTNKNFGPINLKKALCNPHDHKPKKKIKDLDMKISKRKLKTSNKISKNFFV